MYFTSASYLLLLLTEAFKYSTFLRISQNLPTPPPATHFISIFYGRSKIIYPTSAFPIFLSINTINVWQPYQPTLKLCHLSHEITWMNTSTIHSLRQVFYATPSFPLPYSGNIFPHLLLLCSFTASAYHIL